GRVGPPPRAPRPPAGAAGAGAAGAGDGGAGTPEPPAPVPVAVALVSPVKSLAAGVPAVLAVPVVLVWPAVAKWPGAAAAALCAEPVPVPVVPVLGLAPLAVRSETKPGATGSRA